MHSKKELVEILEKGEFSKLEKDDFNQILKLIDEDEEFFAQYFDMATDALTYIISTKGYIDWLLRDDINVYVVKDVVSKYASVMRAYEFEKVIEYIEPDFLFIYDILRKLPKGRLKEWIGLIFDKEYFDEWKMLNREYTILAGAILIKNRSLLIDTHSKKLEAFAYSYNFPEFVKKNYKLGSKEDYYSMVIRANLHLEDPIKVIEGMLKRNKHYHLTYKAILNLAKKYPDAPWIALETLRSRDLRLKENIKLLNFLSRNVGSIGKGGLK
ncbi:hypothetical protein [Acidianus ambivalens]|uniref:Uncharacterized protein n=1 Tax=Acidianus ambivalens TaxID=2283 RepID=A0A650CW32_ACIAM|nr:hypothetical protein [Acidianus ambivalens]MQL54254.1 hypothetical protein [Acidianus ambivalens]QGR22081.1 hypothetical protein D1866_08835 [Acidianus ambivalens]